MSERKKVYLCVAKKTKYGWIGKLGMSDISISFGRKNPEDLVISLMERPQQDYQKPNAQPPKPTPPPRQAPPSQPAYDYDDPGPDESDLPF